MTRGHRKEITLSGRIYTPAKPQKQKIIGSISFSPRSPVTNSPRRFHGSRDRARGERGKMFVVSRLDLLEKIGKFENSRHENLARSSGGHDQLPEGASPPVDRQVSCDFSCVKNSAAGQPNHCTLAKQEVCNGKDDWCTPGQACSCGTHQPIGRTVTSQGTSGIQLGQHGGTETAAGAGAHLANRLSRLSSALLCYGNRMIQ